MASAEKIRPIFRFSEQGAGVFLRRMKELPQQLATAGCSPGPLMGVPEQAHPGYRGRVSAWAYSGSAATPIEARFPERGSDSTEREASPPSIPPHYPGKFTQSMSRWRTVTTNASSPRVNTVTNGKMEQPRQRIFKTGLEPGLLRPRSKTIKLPRAANWPVEDE